jgi:hypothetical protein
MGSAVLGRLRGPSGPYSADRRRRSRAAAWCRPMLMTAFSMSPALGLRNVWARRNSYAAPQSRRLPRANQPNRSRARGARWNGSVTEPALFRWLPACRHTGRAMRPRSLRGPRATRSRDVCSRPCYLPARKESDARAHLPLWRSRLGRLHAEPELGPRRPTSSRSSTPRGAGQQARAGESRGRTSHAPPAVVAPPRGRLRGGCTASPSGGLPRVARLPTDEEIL